MPPKFFRTQAAFRVWLAKNHSTSKELLVGFHKKDSGLGGITYPQALDEALCHGWIDGVRKSFNETSYTIRFTPRRARSIWSAVNIKRAGELIELGKMAEPGLREFQSRDPKRANLYAFERQKVVLNPALERVFRAQKAAWDFFQAQPPGYRRVLTWWVESAKKDETKASRLQKLIEASAAGRRIL